MRRVEFLGTATLVALGLAACGDAQTPTGTPGSAAATSASLPAAPACVPGSIKADGSSAIKSLMQKAGDAYQATCPGATIQVAATNSSTGVTKASSGAVDVGDLDVPASLMKGVDPATVVDHQIAIATFVVAVNPSAGVTNLSSQQIRDIFSGKTTNWSQVGGANLAIAVLERKPGSGTRLTFDKDLMAGTDETSNPAQVVDTNQALTTALTGTSAGVSYLVASGLKGTSLVAVTIDGAAPTSDNVSNGTYPFFAHEHCFTGVNPSQLTVSFLRFILSTDFQNGTLVQAGYLPLSTTTRQAAVDK